MKLFFAEKEAADKESAACSKRSCCSCHPSCSGLLKWQLWRKLFIEPRFRGSGIKKGERKRERLTELDFPGRFFPFFGRFFFRFFFKLVFVPFLSWCSKFYSYENREMFLNYYFFVLNQRKNPSGHICDLREQSQWKMQILPFLIH